MKKQLLPVLGLLLVVAALSGCGKSSKPASPLGSNTGNGGATATDVAQVGDQLATNPSLVDEDVYQDATPMTIDAGGPGFAAIRPLRWWRAIESSTRSIDTQFGDPDSLGRPRAAVVTITRHLVGTFNVVVGDTTPTDTTRRVIRKPLDDTWVRKIALHRFRFPEDTTKVRAGWRIVGTSGVLVTSKDATTHIQSVRVQAGPLDTTVTDPLQLHRLTHVLCFRPLGPVRVTVTTGRNDDIVLLYRHMMRNRFVNNGDGTYTVEFRDMDFGGLRHFGVNALSNGTLFDDTAPYDSQAWLMPFAARPFDAEIGLH